MKDGCFAKPVWCTGWLVGWLFDEIDEYVDGSFLLSRKLDRVIVQATTRVQVLENIRCIFNIPGHGFHPRLQFLFFQFPSR